jgi:predicted dehydrogenase
MGRTWAKNLSKNPDVELVGWADVRPGAAEESAEHEKLLVEWLGTDFRKGIADLALDFVVDVTPPEVHHEVTTTALDAGLPVLGEKPMASSMEEARAMVAASERSGKLYMVSQSRRYHGYLQAYRAMVQSLGTLALLNADFYIGAHFGGFRDEMPSPLVLDMAIHTFDAARTISGLNPVGVYAEEFNPDWSWYQGDACATAIFEMEGGTRFTYRGSWCAEGINTSWESEWRAVGARGTATWDGHDSVLADHVKATGGFFSEFDRSVATKVSMKEGIEGSLEEFLQALDSGELPQGECNDNIKSLAMVFGVIESSTKGRKVSIDA